MTDTLEKPVEMADGAAVSAAPKRLFIKTLVATAALADAITSIGKEYEVNPGDGAFYGPKLDFHIQDSLAPPAPSSPTTRRWLSWRWSRRSRTGGRA